VRYKNAGEALLPLLKDDQPRARFFAAEALGRIGYSNAIDGLVALLAQNNDEDTYIRHAASLALARIGNAEALTALATNPSDAVRMGAVIALRRMRNDGVQKFLADRNEYIVTEAARAINDDLSIEGALPALGNILTTTPFKNEALIRRAINANLRVGTPEALQNLLTYSATISNPEAMRAEAVAALSTWAKPSVVDRVDGRYRGEITRDGNVAKSTAAETLLRLTNDKVKAVRLATVRALGKLKVEQASTALAKALRSDADEEVREAALRSLAEISDPKIGDAISLALQDKSKNVRSAALDLLPKMKLKNELMVSLLANVIDTKTVEEKQAALTTLGNIPVEYTQQVFEQLLNKHDAGKFPVEATLELGEAIDKTGSNELKQSFKTINAKSASDTLRASFAGALYGGDPDRGAQIFYSHQTAQCIRCHSYGDYGGNAGPRLNGVAQRLKREQLLEAVIDPSARLAPGYGMITLDLTDGNKISGILMEDKPDMVKIKLGNKPDTVVLQSSIAKRSYAQSSMPPMRLLLTKKEIRDVVSFLATMKE